MKQIGKIVLAVLLLLNGVAAAAHNFEIDGIYYNITSHQDQTVIVTYCGNFFDEYSNEYVGNVTIPSNIIIYEGRSYSVTAIDEWAFYGCPGLTSVTIPNSVTSIGDCAFFGCTGLTSVTIGNSVTSIGGSAFYGCPGLASVTIPNSVTSIGLSAFEGCTGLTSITVNSGNSVYDSREGCNAIIETATNTLIAGCKSTIIPGSVTSIGFSAFRGCTGLTNIEIPGSVTSIGWCAFEDCTGLKSVTIPNSVTTIGEFAFRGCTGLTGIEIPSSVTSIGCCAFENCTGLTNVTIPNSVTTIESCTFSGCSSLTNITIPNSVTSIGEHAFAHTGLTEIKLCEGVSSIGTRAFVGCKNLKKITLPSSLSFIGEDAFGTEYNYGDDTDYSVSLNEVHISDFAAWCQIYFENIRSNPCYYLPNAEKFLLNGKAVADERRLVIPDGVAYINNYALTGFYSTILEIPQSVQYIGENHFRANCIVNMSDLNIVAGSDEHYNIASIANVVVTKEDIRVGDYYFRTIDGVNNLIAYVGSDSDIELPADCLGESYEIGYKAFASYYWLKNVKIPYGVTGIGEYAFQYSGLQQIVLPNSVTSIGYNAFDGCWLKEIYSLAKTPPTIDSSTFNDYSATLYVPYGTKSAYQAADYWENFTNIVEMEPEYASGDVNGDSRVSVADITTVVDAILNESSDAAYDVNGDSRVSVADITTIVDIILNEGASAASNAPARVATRSTSALSLYIDPFEINAGEEKEILVNLSNPGTEITAVEFDLFLPAGLEVVSDEYGYYVLPGSRTPNKRVPHSVSSDLLSSGAIHVICYHNSQLAFTGEDGDVLAITIKAADDLEPGNYTIDLKNIELVNPADPKNGILISDNNTVVTDIENIEAEEEGTTVIYDLSGRKVAEPVKGGIYIINGKKVVVE